MTLNRRNLLLSVPVGAVLGAVALPIRSILGQSSPGTPVATPAATPVAFPAASFDSLEDSLLAIEPDELLSRLVDSEVTTTLFPSDTGPVDALEWDDTSDSDLENAVGGVLMQTDTDREGNFIGPGVYIVLRNVDDATERLATTETRDADPSAIKPVTIAGFPGFSIVASNDVGESEMELNAVTLLQVGYVLISALADGPAGGSAELRSAANAVGMLDHLQTLVTLTA
jgi:hypothetical protein